MYPYKVLFGMGFYEIFLIIAMLSALFIADKLGIQRGFSVKLQKLVIVAAVAAAVRSSSAWKLPCRRAPP